MASEGKPKISLSKAGFKKVKRLLTSNSDEVGASSVGSAGESNDIGGQTTSDNEDRFLSDQSKVIHSINERPVGKKEEFNIGYEYEKKDRKEHKNHSLKSLHVLVELSSVEDVKSRLDVVVLKVYTNVGEFRSALKRASKDRSATNTW